MPKAAPMALAEVIREGLEAIFTPENLGYDPYLRSQMTSQLFVPIAALAQCKRLAALQADNTAIVEAAKTSSMLTVDASGTMLRDKVAVARRNTLLLRDVVAGTSAEDIASLFRDESGAAAECPQPFEPARAESADSWVVTFADEASCLGALEHIRGRSCRGAAIKARVRLEDLLRTLPPLGPGLSADDGATGGAQVRAAPVDKDADKEEDVATGEAAASRASPPDAAAEDSMSSAASVSNGGSDDPAVPGSGVHATATKSAPPALLEARKDAADEGPGAAVGGVGSLSEAGVAVAPAAEGADGAEGQGGGAFNTEESWGAEGPMRVVYAQPLPPGWVAAGSQAPIFYDPVFYGWVRLLAALWLPASSPSKKPPRGPVPERRLPPPGPSPSSLPTEARIPSHPPRGSLFVYYLVLVGLPASRPPAS